MPPTTSADEGEEPQLPERRRPQRGGPVDRRQQDVAHLGPLERQRPAAAARPQPEGDGEGGDHPDPARPVAQHVSTWAAVSTSSPTMLDEHDDHDQAEDAGQVGLVEDVDPVDVGDALLAPEPPPVREAPLEVGVRITDRVRRRSHAGCQRTQIRAQRRSMIMAMPWPPPTHMDSRP